MIVDFQVQETPVVAADTKDQFVTVQDIDLMYVSGGGASGVLF